MLNLIDHSNSRMNVVEMAHEEEKVSDLTFRNICIYKLIFYLPHMEYEGSIGFVMRKMKFFFADFHVLGLFMAKKHDLSDKKISVCHAPLLYAKFALHLRAWS
jgi:hypothetical protein